jgi:hypothetical protein
MIEKEREQMRKELGDLEDEKEAIRKRLTDELANKAAEIAKLKAENEILVEDSNVLKNRLGGKGGKGRKEEEDGGKKKKGKNEKMNIYKK